MSPAAWFTRARQTSVGTTQGILAGPRRLCTSLAIGGPAPALLSIPRPGEQQPSQCHPLVGLPRVLGARGRGCAPWVLPCEGASHCTPCSHWSDRMAAFQYRVPDLTGKNYVLFRFSIILNINWPYPSLLWFYLEFLAPKSPLGMQNCCLANIWTLTLGNLIRWSQLSPKKECELQISASEGTPGPWPTAAGPGCSRAKGERSYWESRARLSPSSCSYCSTEKTSYDGEQSKTIVSSTAWEKNMDEARDGLE